MKFTIDTNSNSIVKEVNGDSQKVDLYSDEGFEALSHLWLKVGWNQKYTYSFSWAGRPIIQLPDDMIRMQEVIYHLKPDVILETGVAHGGSLIFYAGLCKMMDRGRVIGVDIEIRPHNRKAIEEHELFSKITLIEGDAVSGQTVDHVRSLIRPDETVLVILDSCHTYDHVMKELEAYSGLVTPGSYIVSTDGFMKDLTDVPRGNASWKEDNPAKAAIDFVNRNSNFELIQPPWPFNESTLSRNVTHWPEAWLKKRE